MSLNQPPPHDNDFSAQSNGHDDDRSRARSASDYWIKCPLLYAKCQSVGADIISLRRGVVHGPGARGYKRIVGAIRITKVGDVECSGCVTLTDDEKKDMAAEVAAANFPKSKPAGRDGLPPELKDVDPSDYYVFRNAQGEILFIEHRIPPKSPGGKKQCVPYVYCNDDQWHKGEPDLLPVFGLDRLAKAAAKITTVFLHEGPKAARKWQEMISGTLDDVNRDELKAHPWGDLLQYGEHVGWAGGALRPHHTDWEPLKNLPPDVLIVMICDNDQPGMDAATTISRILKRRMTVVRFNSMFPEGFDLADPWPQRAKWRAKNGDYIGPTLMDLETPATWATDVISTGKKGRPAHVIRTDFAAEWIYASEPDLFINRLKPHLRYSETVFDHEYSTFSDDAKPSRLLRDVFSSKVNCLAYRPGIEPAIITEGDKRKFNVHVPSKVRSKQGDARLWEEFMEQLLPVESERLEVMRWCATLVARPDVRMIYGLFLASEEQGVGKSVLGRILAKLVGEHNAGFPNENDITASAFNDWLGHKRLVIANEIYAGENHHAYNRLKPFITEPEVLVNEKFVKAYRIENWAHFIICSNNKTRALRIDDKDRRLLVVRVTEEKLPGKYWDDFFDWLDDGGYQIIAWWAQQFLKKNAPVKTSDRAPMTAAKKDMLRAGWSPGKELVFDLATKIKEEFDKGRNIAVGRDVVRDWLAAARVLMINDPKLEGKDLIGATMVAAGLHLVVDVSGKETPRFKNEGFKTPIYTNYPTEPGITWAELKPNWLKREELLEGGPWSPAM